MAASGKKKGKKKGKTLNLNEFLSTGDNSPAPGTSFVFASKSSWAEESETADGDYNAQTSWADSSSAGMPDRISLPTAPKSAQQVEIDKDKLPPNPPYTIYLGNLPFDCETEDIEKFLIAATCNVSDVRLPTEGDSSRPKGFGYAEVEDMDSLYKALALNNTQLKNRRIRVDLASQAQTDGRGGDRGFDKTPGDWRRGADTNRGGGGEWNQGGQGGGQGGDRYGSASKPSESDRDRWRDRGGTDTPDRGGGSFGNRGYDGDRGFSRDRGGGGGGGGFERNYDRGGSGGGGGFDRDRGGDGGFGREWNRDRGGGGGGVGSEEGSGGGGYDRRSDRGPERFDRGGGPDRGYDRGGQDRGFERGGPERGGPDRGGPDRGGYGQGRGGYDNKDEGRDDWRKSEEGAPAPARRGGDEDYAPASDRGPGEPPRERKRLVLTKRTQPIEKNPAKAASASSIFGGAKPVDTATKEREIAERLEREKRQYEQQRVTQNMEKDISRKEGPEHTNARVRRDSERSEGREGRTRHSSSGSGRGGPRPVIMRRESERSNDEEVFHKDDQAPVSPTPTSPPPPKTPTSPRQEDVKLIPAPPPKENAWAKRSHSETVASPPAGSAGSKASHGPGDRSYGETGAWRDGDSRPRGGGRGGGGGGGPPSGRGQAPRSGGERGGGRGGGGGGARTDGDRSKPPGPMPKYEEPKARDWSDANKFSSVLEDELGNTSD